MGMKRRRLGGAVIVLGALALAASASAECAWVLWGVHGRIARNEDIETARCGANRQEPMDPRGRG